jgi:hypothetical protein
MRKGARAAILFILVCRLSPSAAAQLLQIVPTTTLAQQTSRNTSAPPNFQAQTNGNETAGNVSKVDTHTLLYDGATSDIYAELQPWFGDKRHMDIGYVSWDPAEVEAQIEDMQSRGITGVIIDWYGPADPTIATTEAWFTALLNHPGFKIMIMIDKGAITLSPCQGCNPQQTLIYLTNYVLENYAVSPSYATLNGKPMITEFDLDLHFTLDWNAVEAATSPNVAWIFENAGGFTHPLSSGSYSWMNATSKDYGMDYLTKFYNAGAQAPALAAWGAGYKGFNDTLASWSLDRVVGQQCGQTWLETYGEINSYYNAGNQLPFLQLVTWNDYEEGTEIETGIDNCFSVSAQVSGPSLTWQTAGRESTIDHYVIYISTDGQNLMPLVNLAPGSRSLNLCSYSLSNTDYVAYVQAVGKPSLKNQMSAPVVFSAQCALGSITTVKGALNLGVSPAILSVASGSSSSARIILTPIGGAWKKSVSLSCSNLPEDLHCSISPSTVTPGARATMVELMISSAANGRPRTPPNPHPGGGKLLALVLSDFGVAGLAFAGSLCTRKRMRKLLLLGTVVLGAGMLSACGSGLGSGTQTASVNPAEHTYTFMVNGDSGRQHTSTEVRITVN